jgi:tryptophanyl-tRNA synthetase
MSKSYDNCIYLSDSLEVVAKKVRGMVTDTQRPFRDNGHAKRFERLEEERLARCVIADSECDVVKHAFSCRVCAERGPT